MEDLGLTNPPAADAADPEVNQPEPSLGLSAGTAPDDTPEDILAGAEAGAPAPQDDDSEEVEHDGQKYRVPKALKPALMMHADYTRKTQEVAEQRRALETQHQQFQQARQLQQQYIADIAQVTAIDQRLAQFQQLNWQQLIDSDPVQAMKLQHEARSLEQQRAQASNSLAQKQQQAALAEQQRNAKLAQDAEAFFAREIPNWTPQRSDELKAYAINAGFNPASIANIAIQNPPFAVLLNKAALYDQIAAKAAPTKAPPSNPVAAKPTAQLPAGKSTVKKDPTEMNDAEFSAWRRKTIAKR